MKPSRTRYGVVTLAIGLAVLSYAAAGGDIRCGCADCP